MLIFSPIPESYLDKILHIEIQSNPNPWQIDNLIDAYHQFTHLGAFRDTELIAFILYQTVLDEAEIIHIVCDKDQQHRGYASALLSTFCQQLKQQNHEKVFLEVREDNILAQQLYNSLGFITVGRRKNYYGGLHDALIQHLNLATYSHAKN